MTTTTATPMTYEQMVQRNGSSIKHAINHAVRLTEQAMPEFTLRVGKFLRGAVRVEVVAVAYEEQADWIGVQFDLFIFRNGSEFVAVPDFYADEDVAFVGTDGNWYTA